MSDDSYREMPKRLPKLTIVPEHAIQLKNEAGDIVCSCRGDIRTITDCLHGSNMLRVHLDRYVAPKYENMGTIYYGGYSEGVNNSYPTMEKNLTWMLEDLNRLRHKCTQAAIIDLANVNEKSDSDS